MLNFTISATAKKANKKIAYDMAVKLKQGETLKDNELDSLLLYFAPSIPKKATSAIQWVAKAAATNDVRFYLNYVRVQDGFAYATDGARIHRAPSDLGEGYYCPKTLAAVHIENKPPDYERVLTRLADTVNTRATLGELTKGLSGKDVYLLHESLDVGAFENQLVDALNSQDDSASFEYEPYNVSYRLIGSSEFGDFVVMPMRVKP